MLLSVFKKWWSINKKWCAETSGTGQKPKVRPSPPSFSFHFLTENCQTSKFHLSFYYKHCCIPESAHCSSKIKAGNTLFETIYGFADSGQMLGKCIKMLRWDMC